MLGPTKLPMTLFESIKICMKGYFRFRGRGRRSEFWPFYIIITIINIILYSLILAFSHYEVSRSGSIIFMNRVPNDGTYVLIILELIFNLGTFLPLIAASTRRLHDTGKSGWLFFVFSFHL